MIAWSFGPLYSVLVIHKKVRSSYYISVPERLPFFSLFLFSLGPLKSAILWKPANITPVHKGDNWELVETIDLFLCYSLVWSVLRGACLERISYNTYSHVSPYLSEWQHGFVEGRSCEV